MSRPIEHKALLCFVNRAAGWLGGDGGRRRGPVAGGPAERVPDMGRHEDITVLVFDRVSLGGAKGAQERAPSAKPCLHAITPNGANPNQRGRGPSLLASTRYAERGRSQRARMSACLSPPASGCRTERSESGRPAERFVGSREAEWSAAD